MVNVLSERALGDLGEYPGHGVDPVHRIVFHQVDHLQPVRAELPLWNRRFSLAEFIDSLRELKAA